jgi:hypothetical protein
MKDRGAGLALVFLVAVFVVGCAAAPSPAPAATVPAATNIQALRSDGRLAELTLAPAVEAALVAQDRAVALAAGALAGQAAAADTRLVLLTIRGMDDGAVSLDGRPVWLVTFRDRPFSVDACACEGSPSRPRTAVVVDAADGAVLATIGIAG